MALVVGITGGIGSGKTTLTKFFEALGVPVYHADSAAKELMNLDRIKLAIIALLGEQSYIDGHLNREYLRAIIFTNDDIREQINAIVHPEVKKHFNQWLLQQKVPYILKEAAIIFEEGLEAQYDAIITVVADKELRIERVLDRPGLTRDSVEQIMSKQWADEAKIVKSDYVIYNNDLDEAKRQVREIHAELLAKSGEL
jgi:dephospho-CoA kinase